ncbi:anaerobic ribonucleoside-triphosphate reductase activating protein [Rhodobacter capsulatus]|uniref:anaerobic ribonucleoside-triphosphate reductase activating protein n=1 Tax=Rhodobacter capsulatus TaxID=1061 RepID=UPI001141DF63|nr:anaerobic ribonucleoside-triphosphate reductase activating protein [Rhodobacter capsulatus]TQD33177.1 anaerobic ribonucleoside-triphosphate reductase activating protein [Rhodobacter capsulatus]
MAELAISGLVRHSACDWPGELVAVLFTQGCPWSCRYCHNPDLIPARAGTLPWAEVRDFLQSRRGLLDGVVISGGEPTLQAALPAALAEIRSMGFRTGLHSAGPYPERLARVLPLLDWVGFDVKAPFADYPRITGVPGSGLRAHESLRLLQESGVAHALRTTVHPRLLGAADLDRIGADLAELGLPMAELQPFRAAGCIDTELCAT